MNNLSRNELIKALVKGLKLDDNIFNYQSVAEETEQIQEHQFVDFYKAVMSADTFGNGLKAIIKTAEQFKPQHQDLTEIKAKELIQMVESINTKIGEDAKQRGEGFEHLVSVVKLPGVSESDMAILNQVKPYTDHKQLIINIRHYATSLEQLKAFKDAVEYSQSYSGAIENSRVKKLISQ